MDDVLTFCHVQDGIVELLKTPFYLSHFINNALKTIEDLCIERKVKFETIRVQNKPLRMYVADVQRLGNALVHLLDHAARAAKMDSTIEIKVYENDLENNMLTSTKKFRNSKTLSSAGIIYRNVRNYIIRKAMNGSNLNQVNPDEVRENRDHQESRQQTNNGIEQVEIRGGGEILPNIEIGDGHSIDPPPMMNPISREPSRKSFSNSVGSKLRKVVMSTQSRVLPLKSFCDITLTVSYCREVSVSDDEFYSAFSITMDTLRPEELPPAV